MNYKKLGCIKASEYIKDVLKFLKEGPKMPKELADENGYRMSHISGTLADLKEKGLVECLTPEIRKGRLYSLTEEGKEILEEL